MIYSSMIRLTSDIAKESLKGPPRQNAPTEFSAQLSSAQDKMKNDVVASTTKQRIQRLPAPAPAQEMLSTIKTSQGAAQTTSTASQSSPTSPFISFPENFPEKTKERLIDFFNRTDLTSKEKDAVWATIVGSVDFQKNGLAGVSAQATEDARLDSQRFDPLKLLADCGKVLSRSGYPNVGQAVQAYLQKLPATT